MIKGLRTFLYELKYAFVGMKRHIMLCFSAISAIGITLLLIGSVLIIGLHVNYFSNDVQKDLSIHVILNEDIEDSNSIKKIEKDIIKLKNVSKVEFSTKYNELELMIKEKGDAFKAYRGKSNPLSNAFFVYVKDASSIGKTSTQIENIKGVSSTAFGGDSVTSLVKMLNMIQKIGLGIVTLLILLSLYLIYNTIKTTIDSRSDEIMIMRTVGATNGFISNPFIVEGIFIGLLGAVIPFMLVYFGYEKLYESLGGKLFTPMFSLFKPSIIRFEVGLSIIFAGVLIGAFASLLAVRKYLKMKR